MIFGRSVLAKAYTMRRGNTVLNFGALIFTGKVLNLCYMTVVAIRQLQ